MAAELPSLYPLGIVGTGQIARLTHQAALKLGLAPRLLSEGEADSAALAADDPLVAHPDAVSALASTCDVVTFEHERLDLRLVEYLEQNGATFRPGVRALRASVDKLWAKRTMLNRGFPVGAFAELRGPDDALDFASVFGWPLVVKAIRSRPGPTRSVWIVENETDLLRVLSEHNGQSLLVEEFQPIVAELVVLVVRRPGGRSVTYPVAQAVTVDGRCAEIRMPAAVGAPIAAEATELAERLADELDAVGVFAVELFLTHDGLVVNEPAARPHNAGHPTIEGTPTSQFENHVRAVLDLPLGATGLVAPAAVAVNVFGTMKGSDPARHLRDALAVEGVSVHLYGKTPVPGAKLGHVTALGADVDAAADRARRAEAALRGHR